MSMWTLSFVALAGLCLGSLAEDFGTEGSCTADGCAVRGSALLQKDTARGRGQVPEEAAQEPDRHPVPSSPAVKEQKPVPIKEAREGADEVDDADELAELGSERLPDCSKWKPGKVFKKVRKFEDKMDKINAGIQKCQDKKGVKIDILEKKLAYLEKCLSGYGFFVEDGVSEGDGDSEAEDEFDYDDVEDTDIGKPCPRKQKKVEKKIGNVKAKLAKLTKRKCKSMRCDEKKLVKIDKFYRKLAYLEKCLGGYGFFVEDGVSEGDDDSEAEDGYGFFVEDGVSEGDDDSEAEDELADDDMEDTDIGKPCPRKQEKVEKKIGKTKAKIDKLTKKECKSKKRAAKLEKAEEKMNHFYKCLG